MLTIPIILETSPSHLCFDCATAPLSIPLSCLSHLSMSQISVIFCKQMLQLLHLFIYATFYQSSRLQTIISILNPFFSFVLSAYTPSSPAVHFFKVILIFTTFFPFLCQTFITSHMNNCRVFLADLPVAIPKFSLKV